MSEKNKEPIPEGFMRAMEEIRILVDQEHVPDAKNAHDGIFGQIVPTSKEGKVLQGMLDSVMAARSPDVDETISRIGAETVVFNWFIARKVQAEIARTPVPKRMKERHYLDPEGNPRRATENDRERWRVHRDHRAHYKLSMSILATCSSEIIKGIKMMGLATMLEPKSNAKGYDELMEKMAAKAQQGAQRHLLTSEATQEVSNAGNSA